MQELSYAIVTPYSMRKSRTGGIVARLISRTGLDIVAGRMFAPSAELVKRYAETIVTETESRHRATQELIREYVRRNFTGKINGQRPRVLFLVFRGEDAVALRGPRSTGPWPSFTVAPARTLWHRKAGGNKLVHHPLCTEPSRLRRGTTPVRPDPRHPGPHQRSRGGTPLAPLHVANLIRR